MCPEGCRHPIPPVSTSFYATPTCHSWPLGKLANLNPSRYDPVDCGIRVKSGSAKRAAFSRSSAAKARVASDNYCAKRYMVREVNHIFDIVDTFFYAARIPAGWFFPGGENVRIFGSEIRLPWNLGACVFWLPRFSRCQGRPRHPFLPRRARGFECPWALSNAGLEKRRPLCSHS